MDTAKRIARPAEPTLRHLWLAGLGLGSVAGRKAAHLRERVRSLAAGHVEIAHQALHRLGEQVPGPIHERILPPLRARIRDRLRPTAAVTASSASLPAGRALQVHARQPSSPPAMPRANRTRASSVVSAAKSDATTPPASSRAPHRPSTAGAGVAPPRVQARKPLRRG